jgi:tetratricopeptide (TPR) repeat protein
MVWNGLSDTLFYAGRYEEARELGERALRVLDGSTHLAAAATSLSMLAQVAWKQNQKGQAEQYLRRAAVKWERSVGVDHPSYASALASLAVALSNVKPEEADRLFQQALQIVEAKLGPTHSYRGWVMLLYSRHLKSHGRKAQAKELKRGAEVILNGQSIQNHVGFTMDAQM